MREYISELIAAGVVVLFVGYIGLAIVGAYGASLVAVNSAWFGLYTMVVLMSATKLYGKSIYKAVKTFGEGALKVENNNDKK